MLGELKGSTYTKRGMRREKRRRTVSTVLITLLVFALLAVSAGLVYVWWTGSHTEVTVSPAVPVKKPTLPETPKIADNSPVGVAISVFSSPIAAGSNAAITIRTKPKAACSIAVTYDKDRSTDSGLVPKTADQYGVVGWSWTVESNRPAGKWPVDVTCALGDRSGYVRGDLVVTH